MMAHRRKKRVRQAFRHTAQELRKWSKTRLIRLILRLESARILRTVRRRITGGRKRGSTKRKLSAGVHIVRIKGKARRVRVNSKGQWRFLKNKARSSNRRRRSSSRKRRASRR